MPTRRIGTQMILVQIAVPVPLLPAWLEDRLTGEYVTSGGSSAEEQLDMVVVVVVSLESNYYVIF